jgi:acetyl-CoA synthetase
MASTSDAAALVHGATDAHSLLSRAGFLQAGGSWKIDRRVISNIAVDTVGRYAIGPQAQKTALIHEAEDGSVSSWSFAALMEAAGRLASELSRLGVGKSDPVGVHMGQRPDTAIAHLAVHLCGGIVCTMSEMYGPDTLSHILRDTRVKTIITRRSTGALRQAIDGSGQAVAVIAVEPAEGELELASLLSAGDPSFAYVATTPDDPALLMYTSGSTGHPKGMLHAHRVLGAYLPTVNLFYNLALDEPDAVFWSPADWAWVGGLLDLVLPAWAYGQTVLSWEGRFDAERCFELMSKHGVTHSFMTPTALKRLAEVENPRARWPLSLRYLCSGGESLPGEVVRWAQEQVGAVCNEFYGLTEFNHLVGNCSLLYPIRPGSMGKIYPGHDVRLVDESGRDVPNGDVGEIVASADDPTLFLGYWGQPGVPESLRLGRWIRTRDLARLDDDGYVWYQGRNDDLIKSAGYRIGPAEVEDTLLKHPAVAEAAVVASPDLVRGSIVKAFIRLREGVTPSPALVIELQQKVKSDLAAYKYPREIEFVDEFPLTSSGKIRRAELRRRELHAKASLP